MQLFNWKINENAQTVKSCLRRSYVKLGCQLSSRNTKFGWLCGWIRMGFIFYCWDHFQNLYSTNTNMLSLEIIWGGQGERDWVKDMKQ